MSFRDANAGVVQLSMKFAVGEEGWTEKVYFEPPNSAAVMTKAIAVVQYRLALLPTSCRIKYACLQTLGKPRGAKRVQGNFPADGFWQGLTTVVGDIEQNSNLNDSWDAVQIRFEDGDENYATRFLHGIPDAQVKNRDLVDTVGVGNTTPGAAANDTDTVTGWGARLTDYIRYLKTNTMMARKNVNLVSTTVWQIATPDVVYGDHFTRHRVGAPFGTTPGRYPPR